jgi:hypothetical protein
MADQTYSHEDIRPLLEALSILANSGTLDALTAQQTARDALQKFGALKQCPAKAAVTPQPPGAVGRKRYKPEPLM